MKEYKNTAEKEQNIINEPAVAYQIQPATPEFKIPRDKNGKPIGYTVDEVFDEIDQKLSKFYGVDFMKITQMIRSGALDENDISNELLCSQEFKYEPYPGFKPKPLPTNFVPDPSLIGIFDDE
jgi:hypothetical protein